MISVPNTIRLLITNQYRFLCSMLQRFPLLLNNWMKEQEKVVIDIAKEVSAGDTEVYRSIYNSEISRMDDCYDEECLFYNAMFLMAYSYYESLLLRLAKEELVDNARPSIIAKKHNCKLDSEILDISEYIQNTIRPLRNQLAHNNNGTLFAKDISDEEKQNIQKLVKNELIEITEGKILIKGPNIIYDLLKKEYKILINLADICGYKTRFVN